MVKKGDVLYKKMSEAKEDYTQYKIILLGNSGVGKTAIITRYCKELFSNDMDPTIGVNFQAKFIEVNGKTIKLAIWDTAGQEKFRTITRQFYRKVDGVVLVYDIADRQSLEDLEKIWIPELNSNVQGCQMMLVGNKLDLKDDPELKDKIVPKEDGENVARKYATLFVEASAKNSEGVKNLFEELVQRLVDSPQRVEDDSEGGRVSIDPNAQPSSYGCAYC